MTQSTLISRMAVKRTLKRAAGHASLALSPLAALSAPAVCILVYHRVADIDVDDPDRDNWNVPPRRFEQQMAALADWADIVSLDRLPEFLGTGEERSKPAVAVTFDDGFASVYTEALPILRRYGIPATVFIVTGSIGAQQPMSFDGWSRHNADRVPIATWRSMTWNEIEGCATSGLITLGAHSHQHLDGRLCSVSQLNDEAARSRAVLRERLGGNHARAYAYPYGSTRLGEVPPRYVDAVRMAGYQCAVSTDLGRVTRRSDVFRLPRVEANAVDSPAVLRAKVRGSLAPLWITDRLRRADRTA